MVSDAAEASLGPGAVQRIEVESEEEKALKLREEVGDLQEKSRLLREELKRAALTKQEEEETTPSPMPQWMGRPLETGHKELVRSVAISPNDENGGGGGAAARYIATGSFDRTIRIWDVETGRQVGEPLTGHTDYVRSVAISPPFKIVDENNGGGGSAAARYVVSGSDDNTVRIWNMETGRQVGEPLTGHTDWVWSVAISPPFKIADENGNGGGGSAAARYIASGSRDKTVRIWDMETGRQVGEPLTGHTGAVWSVAISPSFKILDGNNGGGGSAAVRYIVSGSEDKTVRVWNMETGRQVGEPLTGHTDWVWSVAISPPFKIADENGNGGGGSAAVRYIVSGSADGTVRVWNMDTGRQVGEPLTGHADSVLSVAISPPFQIVDENGNGGGGSAAARYIASGSADGTVRVWNMETGRQVGEPLRGHTNAVWSVAISPDGRYLVSCGSNDQTIRAWPMPA